MARTTAQKLAVREREAQALKLRLEDRTFDDVAAVLDYANRSGAYKAVERALRDTVRKSADDLRAVQLARLEDAHRAVWSVATNPDDPNQLWAIDAVLRILDRTNKLLGFDESPKTARQARRHA